MTAHALLLNDSTRDGWKRGKYCKAFFSFLDFSVAGMRTLHNRANVEMDDSCPTIEKNQKKAHTSISGRENASEDHHFRLFVSLFLSSFGRSSPM